MSAGGEASTVGSMMKKWTNFPASLTRVLAVGSKNVDEVGHAGEFAACIRLGVPNVKDTFAVEIGDDSKDEAYRRLIW
jgi:hypothetical protein